MGNKSDKSAKRAAEEARQREAARQARLSQGRSSIDNAFAGFDDNYYNTRASAYDEFAMPQLEEQYANQKKALTYALSRGGLLSSSTAAQKAAQLQDEYERNKALVASKGQEYGTNARRDVASSRANLLSILSSTEDPSTVADESLRQAATLRAQPAFDPLGNLFTDIASTIDQANSARQIGSAFNSGGSSLFSRGGKGSGRYVN